MITEYDNFTYIDDKKEIEKLDSSFSNKSTIETSFKNLFNDSNEFIAILSGEWGVGKTYFWDEFAEKTFGNDDYVYISLFGKNSLKEIKHEILLKTSDRVKLADKIKKYSSLGKIVGIDLDMIGTIIDKEDFKDLVICFDDIERISNSIGLKDFMGYLSELKEKNKCKVVVILNENELDNLSKIDDKPHSEIFALYKEKIVNYEFHYKPSVKDCFDIAKKLEKVIYFDEDKLYNFFTKKEIRNIRIMTQCIYHLNKFPFIKDYNLDTKIIDKFLLSALTVFTFKTIHNLSENKFIEFKEYNKNRSRYDMMKYAQKENFTEVFEENSEFKICLGNYTSGNYWDELEEVIYKYLYSLDINKPLIKVFLEKENNNVEYQCIGEKLEKLEDEYLFNLQMTKKEHDTQLIDILDKYKKNLSKALSLEELKIYLDLLDDTTEKDKQNLKQEILENFTTNIMNTQDNELIDKRNGVAKIQTMYPELEQYIKKYRENYILEEDISTFFSKLIYKKKGFLSKKHEILILNNKDIIKNDITQNSSLFKKVIEIIENNSRGSNVEYLIEIIIELENENPEYKYKIQKIKDNLSLFKHKMRNE
ncbi:MAG: ATP-binding protein [Sulfurimonas sp.]|nr:ATP-binding protein [Sulfurimonas sp.]